MNNLKVSLAPFKQKPSFLYSNSLIWILALFPALICGLLLSKTKAITTFCAGFLSYFIFEAIYILLTKQNFKINLVRTIVTAMLIGMLMPPYVPVYMPILCSVFSIMLKIFFGDDNGIIVNKVAFGVVLFITIFGNSIVLNGFAGNTPNQILRNESLLDIELLDLLLGNNINGFIGTTAIICIIFGGLLLIFTKQVNFRVPVMSIISFCLMCLILNGYKNILPELLSGGVLFTLFFLATDYFTCPNNGISGYIYGMFLGILVCLFKLKFDFLGEYAPLFALIISNLFVPIVDGFTPRYFGEVR